MTVTEISAKLVHAATAFDRRGERKSNHNPYALAQYMKRIDEACADIQRGATPRSAIIAAFCDRLRDALLKAIGEPKATREEIDNGAIVYVPVTSE